MDDQKQKRKEIMDSLIKIRRLHTFVPPINGISPNEFYVLRTVGEASVIEQTGEVYRVNGLAIRISDIARQTHLSLPSVSQTVGSLDQKGWIQRIVMPQDRRTVLVSLTDQGAALLTAANHHFFTFINKVIDQLGEADAQELARIFVRLYDIVNELSLRPNDAKRPDLGAPDRPAVQPTASEARSKERMIQP